MSTVVVAVERNEIENLYKIFFLNDKVRVKMTTILQDKKKKNVVRNQKKRKNRTIYVRIGILSWRITFDIYADHCHSTFHFVVRLFVLLIANSHTIWTHLLLLIIFHCLLYWHKMCDETRAILFPWQRTNAHTINSFDI